MYERPQQQPRKSKVDVHPVDPLSGRTALHVAAARGEAPMVTLLASQVRLARRSAPQLRLRRSVVLRPRESTFAFAVDRLRWCPTWSTQAGVDFNAMDTRGRTALCYAVESGAADAVKVLLREGR